MLARSAFIFAAMYGCTASAASDSGDQKHDEILDMLVPSHQKISEGRGEAVTITVLQSVGEDFRVGVTWVRNPLGLQTKVEVWRTGVCLGCAIDRLGQRNRDSINALVGKLAGSVQSKVQMKQAPDLLRWFRLAMEVQDRSAREMYGNLLAQSRAAAVEVTLDGSVYVVEFDGNQRYHKIVLPGPVLSARKDAGLMEIAGLIERTLGSLGAAP